MYVSSLVRVFAPKNTWLDVIIGCLEMFVQSWILMQRMKKTDSILLNTDKWAGEEIFWKKLKDKQIMETKNLYNNIHA